MLCVALAFVSLKSFDKESLGLFDLPYLSLLNTLDYKGDP